MKNRRTIKKPATAPPVVRRRRQAAFKRLVLRIGRTVLGVLPGARRIRAANDSER